MIRKSNRRGAITALCCLFFLILTFPLHAHRGGNSITLGGDVREGVVGFHKLKPAESLEAFVKHIGGVNITKYEVYSIHVYQEVNIYVSRVIKDNIVEVYVFNLLRDGKAASEFILMPGDALSVVKFDSVRIKDGARSDKQMKTFFSRMAGGLQLKINKTTTEQVVAPDR